MHSDLQRAALDVVLDDDLHADVHVDRDRDDEDRQRRRDQRHVQHDDHVIGGWPTVAIRMPRKKTVRIALAAPVRRWRQKSAVPSWAAPSGAPGGAASACSSQHQPDCPQGHGQHHRTDDVGPCQIVARRLVEADTEIPDEMADAAEQVVDSAQV